LESALASYTGTLLLVTHDRRMLDTVHTTRRIEVADGRITER
jgi:ATPase subunit of ABC transporter with duplicated ATPase domains